MMYLIFFLNIWLNIIKGTSLIVGLAQRNNSVEHKFTSLSDHFGISLPLSFTQLSLN
jgi:hypothetical protein